MNKSYESLNDKPEDTIRHSTTIDSTGFDQASASDDKAKEEIVKQAFQSPLLLKSTKRKDTLSLEGGRITAESNFDFSAELCVSSDDRSRTTLPSDHSENPIVKGMESILNSFTNMADSPNSTGTLQRILPQNNIGGRDFQIGYPATSVPIQEDHQNISLASGVTHIPQSNYLSESIQVDDCATELNLSSIEESSDSSTLMKAVKWNIFDETTIVEDTYPRKTQDFFSSKEKGDLEVKHDPEDSSHHRVIFGGKWSQSFAFHCIAFLVLYRVIIILVHGYDTIILDGMLIMSLVAWLAIPCFVNVGKL